ncbi:hypothetical protein C0995_008089 [Termitomyces sp. Mi166|nr:hypothetical protein C0995_008089 [Termitomyces sp. Mi166\
MSDSAPVRIPHFFRLYRGDTVEKALARHRQYLWSYLSLKPGMRVLEIGSGFGTAAIELSHYASVSVVGIESDSFKVEQSKQVAHSGHIQDRVTFVKGDVMQLSQTFKPNTFDAVYAIESFKMAPSFLEAYEEVQYVLKPGGKITAGLRTFWKAQQILVIGMLMDDPSKVHFMH